MSAKLTDAIHVVTREKSSRLSGRIVTRSRVTCHSPFLLLLAQWHTAVPTFAMYQSVTQRVGSIPELLDLIFDHLDPTSNFNNAVVCKIWSEVARDKLWWEVCNPRRLLSILAPIPMFTGVSSVFLRLISLT